MSEKHFYLILIDLIESSLGKSVEDFFTKEDLVLTYQGRLCVPDLDGLRQKILENAQRSRYYIDPRATKMYHDLQEVYWYNGINKDIL